MHGHPVGDGGDVERAPDAAFVRDERERLSRRVRLRRGGEQDADPGGIEEGALREVDYERLRAPARGELLLEFRYRRQIDLTAHSHDRCPGRVLLARELEASSALHASESRGR